MGRKNSGAARSLAQNLNLALRRSLCDTPTPIQSMTYKIITIMNFKWNWRRPDQSTSHLFNTYQLQLTLQKADLFSHFLLNIPLTTKLPQEFQQCYPDLNSLLLLSLPLCAYFWAYAAYTVFQGDFPHQIHKMISTNKCSLIFIGTDTCKFLWNIFNVYISMCSDSVYICHVSINYLL